MSQKVEIQHLRLLLAAIYAKQQYNDATLVVLASDHVIKNADLFREKIIEATTTAQNGSIVTFGIVPTAPETGYGYIKVLTKETDSPLTVERFVEKPQKEVAECYLQEGGYFWNSGMFVMTANSYLDELEVFEPEIKSLCEQAINSAQIDFDFIRPNTESFLACKNISIDYAVMEKSDKVKLIPLDAGWSDVGSWSEVYHLKDKDYNGNALTGDILAIDCKNTLISSSKKRFYRSHRS